MRRRGNGLKEGGGAGCEWGDLIVIDNDVEEGARRLVNSAKKVFRKQPSSFSPQFDFFFFLSE